MCIRDRYRSLIRSKLDYGCIVYGSARGSYLHMLDSVQNYALRLCLGAYRTSPSSSLCVLANEPPLYIRRRKLSIQYCLKLSSSTQNPTYSTVFNCKFKDLFERKPYQIPPLSIRVQPDCWFRKKERLNIFNSCYSSMVIKATPLSPYKLQYSLFLQR